MKRSFVTLQRVFVTLLTVVCLALCLPGTGSAAYERIRSADLLCGYDYTDIPYLAEKLDQIFAGDIGMYRDYRCTRSVSAPLGSSVVAPGTIFYMRNANGDVRGGYSCYVYANAVYNALFGDIPGSGYGDHWKVSRVVMRNAASVSYKMFVNAGVRTGALIRTTANSDGSYNGVMGHSVIVLGYDASGISILDGNGDGKGQIRVTRYTWSEFNWDLFARRSYRLSFLVQPTDAWYDSLMAAPSSSYDLVGYFRAGETYHGTFEDVSLLAPSFNGVFTAYELGLMTGREDGLFMPEEDVTVAEALTLAARFISGYWDDNADFTPREEDEAWYIPCLDYCEVWGIDTSGYGTLAANVSRANFVRLCAAMLPEEELPALREVEDGAFTDIVPEMACYDAVYTLCRAGVLDEAESFFPYSLVSREEAAVILSRLADRAQRAA